MAKKATTTTTADTAVEALTGAALTSAKALVKLGDAVHTSITTKGLEHVNATIELVLQLQPMLNQELAACKRANPTLDKIGAGKFHTWMTDLVARGDGLTWKLDAATTFMAASFKRDARAWAAYQSRIAATGKAPSLSQFASGDTEKPAFQERFKLGHFNAKGELTQAGKDYDQEKADIAFAQSTGKINKWRTFDWSNFWDKDTTKEEKLTIFHELAYFFNAEALLLEKSLKTTSSGKDIVTKVQAAVKKSIKV